MRFTAALLVAALAAACTPPPTPLELAKNHIERGSFEAALAELEKARAAGEREAPRLIAEATKKLEEQKEKNCVQGADDLAATSARLKNIPDWKVVVGKLREYKCERGSVDTAPMIEKAYVKLIGNEAYADRFDSALALWWEFTNAAERPAPRIWVREEEAQVLDEKTNKYEKRTFQRRYALPDHKQTLAMFRWLLERDSFRAGYDLDRYAGYLHEHQRRTEAQEAYELAASQDMKVIGFQVKQRAQLMVIELKKGKFKKLPDSVRYFLAEEAPQKSKLKKLLAEDVEGAAASAPTPGGR